MVRRNIKNDSSCSVNLMRKGLFSRIQFSVNITTTKRNAFLVSYSETAIFF